MPGISIKDVINPSRPFGSIGTETIPPEVWSELFSSGNTIFRSISTLEPAFIVGRRGSGKTGFLRHETRGTKLDLNTSRTVATVEDTLRTFARNQQTTFVEHWAHLWQIATWHAVAAHIVNRAYATEHSQRDDRHIKISNYLSALTDGRLPYDPESAFLAFCHSLQTASDEGVKVHESPDLVRHNSTPAYEIVAATRSILDESSSRYIIKMDSMEEFDGGLERHHQTFAGLFSHISATQIDVSPLDVQLAFPAELWHALRNTSTNPYKDFDSHLVLHWSPRELITIAAKRLKRFLELYHAKFALDHDVPRLDPESFADAQALLAIVLPSKVTGEHQVTEDTMVYILRHTQLLPRHLLRSLNKIWEVNDRLGGGPTHVSEKAVVMGIQEIEKLTVDEICKGYGSVYPGVREMCKSTIKELPRRFDTQELEKVFKHFAGPTRKGLGEKWKARFGPGNDDADLALQDRIRVLGLMRFEDFQGMLVEIGAIGRAVFDYPDEEDESRYIHAQFEYTVEGQLLVGSEDLMCVHPLFSGVFGSRGNRHKSRPDQRWVVFPRGSAIDD